MDMEEADNAVARVIGEAVIQLLAEGRALTKEVIAEMVSMLAGDEPDLAVEFALGMLR
ncbi:hypothetical protein LU604_10735 [Erwinia tracheiphila]|uniref:DUF2767 family protein n=1 Tax=Erwinia tracheiphila TaxID=65700 RepID=A0A345CRM0_9GAMM|nr:hypothetical protein [Erwinia tracheiphila]AXF76087.1 DUF2767 family protein [Erwinia tracheiphila]UIA85253.1 hypothetical protein LU604_10735 [Erwinia tracheiphila]